MAKLSINTTIEAGWVSSDKLRMRIGSENAADLASSVPAGGTIVNEQEIGQAAVGSLVEMTHRYSPSDKCATLPVGISTIDAAGNESAKKEILAQLVDPPDAVGRPNVAATASAGEALLSWDASPDV